MLLQLAAYFRGELCVGLQPEARAFLHKFATTFSDCPDLVKQFVKVLDKVSMCMGMYMCMCMCKCVLNQEGQ